MHHSLRLYSRHRETILKAYVFLASWTRVPLVGGVVRWVANTYGRNIEGAYLLTPGEAEEVVDKAEGVALGPCTCRSVFRNCGNGINTEILLGPSRHIFAEHMPRDSREITKEKAKEILRDCHQKGLVQTIIKCRENYYAICNCCHCCCVPLRLRQQYGIGKALTRNENIIKTFEESQKLQTV